MYPKGACAAAEEWHPGTAAATNRPSFFSLSQVETHSDDSTLRLFLPPRPFPSVSSSVLQVLRSHFARFYFSSSVWHFCRLVFYLRILYIAPFSRRRIFPLLFPFPLCLLGSEMFLVDYGRNSSCLLSPTFMFFIFTPPPFPSPALLWLRLPQEKKERNPLSLPFSICFLPLPRLSPCQPFSPSHSLCGSHRGADAQGAETFVKHVKRRRNCRCVYEE